MFIEVETTKTKSEMYQWIVDIWCKAGFDVCVTVIEREDSTPALMRVFDLHNDVELIAFAPHLATREAVELAVQAWIVGNARGRIDARNETQAEIRKALGL